MANNCLITKLQGSVQNDNLEKLGVLKIHIIDSSGGVNTELHVSGSTTIYTDGTKHLYQFGGDKGTSITHSSVLNVQFKDSGEYDVFIKPKYNISGACTFGMKATIDISQLKYCDITSLISMNTLFSGDIAALSEKSLTTIKVVGSSGLYGSFEDVLGPMITLTGFNLSGTNITGDIIEFVRRQVKAGRSSYTFEVGQISYLGGATGIKFNGQDIRNRDANVLSWQDNALDNTKIDITLQTGTQQQGDAPMTATVAKLV